MDERQLFECMKEGLDRAAFIELCLRVGVDSEHLSGQDGLIPLIVALIRRCRSLGRHALLVEQFLEMRPQYRDAPVPLTPDGSGDGPATKLLREVIGTVLRDASDLDSFCLDYFPDIQRRFVHGQDRVQRVNLLLTHAPRGELLQRLHEFDADNGGRCSGLLLRLSEASGR